MEQFLPAAIMFAFTLAATILFFLPVTMVRQKNELLQFYWSGVWVFLALIAAIAGGSNTLILLNVDTIETANVLLTGVIAAFVAFVVFAWFRLSAAAIIATVKALRSRLATGRRARQS